MAGVNRSNVVVTDTFDTWRIRTNELNTTLNQATEAKTANTIVLRDDDANFSANLATLNRIDAAPLTATDSVIVVTGSTLAATTSNASIQTSGGILALANSRVSASFTVQENLVVNSSSTFGDSDVDTVTFTASINSNVVPTANVTIDLGSTSKYYDNFFVQQVTHTANSSVTGSAYSLTHEGTTANVVTLTADAITTGTMISATSDSSDSSTRNLVRVVNDNTSATGATGLEVVMDAGRGIFIDTNLASGGYALEIDAEQTTSNTAKINSAATTGTILEVVSSGVLEGTAVDITADSATTGTGLSMSMDALTTGTMASFTSESADTSTRDLIEIVNEDALATGTTALNIRTDAGRGIFVNSTLAGGGYALEIDAEHTTSNTAKIDAATTSGTILEVLGSGVLTGKAVDITADSATTGTGLYLSMDGLTSGKMVDLTTTAATTGTILNIIADSATEATGIAVSMDGLTSGQAVDVSSSAEHTGNLASIVSSSTADSARGTTLFVKSSTANNDAYIARFANNSADVLTIKAGGDIGISTDLTISGNLVVTGTTTQLNSTTTLVQDKTIVLGAQSDVVENATFSQDGTVPVVTTSTAHGLSNDDIIFVTTSSSSVIVEEQLLKVVDATLSSTTFSVSLIDDSTIDTSSDASTRTISFVGPQTDAAVDDAGIYVPGSSAIHTFKWDDTANYWEVNDSFKVNTTTQLLFPVGTTAQRPSSATGTIAGATPGAMRFNTDDAVFEGVHAGTEFEAMSTQAYATAIAIALG